jgi:uncharacterized membrane protein YphA (DoxX/SURF4 family)
MCKKKRPDAVLMTRLASIPLLIDICVALYVTKIVTLAKNGLWSTLHEARTDVSMLLGLVFLMLVGGRDAVPRRTVSPQRCLK